MNNEQKVNSEHLAAGLNALLFALCALLSAK